MTIPGLPPQPPVPPEPPQAPSELVTPTIVTAGHPDAPGPIHLALAQWAFVVTVALSGGLLGILGAFIQELRASFNVIGLVAAAPIIEEAVKPAAIYYLQARHPHLLRNQFMTACLSGLSGLSFGLLESLVYIYVYVDDPSPSFIIIRLALTPLLHAFFSFIVGWGINQRLIDSANGKVPFLDGSKRYYVTAMALHATYNLTVMILAITGAWRLD